MPSTPAVLASLRPLLAAADAPESNFASCTGKARAERAMWDAVRPHLRELLGLADVGARLRANRDYPPQGWTDADTARFVERCLDDLERTAHPAKEPAP